ncbi:hypothetical protein [Serratia marcescens]|uniref:hypothetical protein n=1 Tax=Serratia marcescens TaxID=615 RepID=UPI000B603ED4|nr:hypothetical protein [Serratia marcescens]ASM16019.1 hypothetical protein BVG90_04520 [Serratia marcescens]MBH3010820.1 hypothetical protein [Serratia marcescens]MBY4847211.1 hypothetical protein [Serratia marcescens]MCH9865212.1 hypothetical protein [Serratia marcescens]CAI0989576.1 Uncharacterised protein [Serratia marcescens]
MSKYIAYIESPLQAFNLIEYLDANDIMLDLLIVNKRSANSALNHGQIVYLLKMIKHRSLKTIDAEGNLGNAFDIKRQLKSATSVVSAKETVTLIAGEYRARVFWILAHKYPKRDVVLLDDGTATLRIKRYNNVTTRSIVKSVFLKSLGMTNNEREKITFFSVYDIEGNVSKRDVVIKHSYQNFKAKLASLPDGKNRVFIIGTPLFEAGVTSVDDIDLTLKMISDLKSSQTDAELVYIPHRREREEKIEEIRKHVEVRRLDFPFEVYPIVAGENVRSIAGFYSSLYDNLVKIYDEKIKITAYVLDEKVLSPEWVGFVGAIYKNYESYENADITLIKNKL